MQKALMLIVLSALLASSLSGLAQDAETDATVDADACVAAAVADWSLPQTLAEALDLQEALDELIAECGAGAVADDETEGAADEMTDADGDLPRTMYVSSRVSPDQRAARALHRLDHRWHAGLRLVRRGIRQGRGGRVTRITLSGSAYSQAGLTPTSTACC